MHKNIFKSIKEAYYRFPFFRSLKLRIFLLTFLVGTIPMMILSRGILTNYEQRVVNVRISEVQTQLRVLSNHLLLYGYLNDPSSEIVNAELTQFASFYDGRVLVIDDDLRVVKDTYEMATGKTAVSEDVVNCLEKGSRAITSRYVKADGYIEVIMPISETAALEDQDYSGNEDASQEKISGVILASVSTDSIEATLEILGRRATLMEIILFVVVFSITLIFSNLLVRPFDKLTKAISDVRNGFTSSDIRVNDYLETQHIQDAFNQVLGRMRGLDESRQEFVSNVSHELKTPMTSMKVLADSLLADPDTPAEVYRDFMTDIDQEIDRENKIISELLNLSKMDRKVVQMNVTQVNINQLIENIMKRVRPIAQQRDVEMTLISERDVTAEVDEVKMSMVFTNLIENAVKYNREHGKVTVTVDSDRKNMIVTVEDTGVGIPKDAQSRVFERFYRVDKSRSREVGGTGLGLSITKSAVLLHKGTILLESTEGVGSKFTVTVPLNYIADANTPKSQGINSVKPQNKFLAMTDAARSAAVEVSGAGIQDVTTQQKEGMKADQKAKEKPSGGAPSGDGENPSAPEQTKAEDAEETAETTADSSADMEAPMKRRDQNEEMQREFQAGQTAGAHSSDEESQAAPTLDKEVIRALRGRNKGGGERGEAEDTNPKNAGFVSGGFLRVLTCMGALALCLALGLALLTGCSAGQQDSQSGLSLYYLNQEGTSIVAAPYQPAQEETLTSASGSSGGGTGSGAESSAAEGSSAGGTESPVAASLDPQTVLTDMFSKLSSPPEDIGKQAPIQNFTVQNWTLSEGTLTIDVSPEYRQLDKIREILTRAAIVDTVCQIPEVQSVVITCNGEALTDEDGKEIGPQTADMFINNTGREIQNYERVRLHLYFANTNGDQLVDTYRNVVYNSNISMERLVVEQVLKGPNSDVVFPTLNADTKILSVTTRDEVCYVNLDQTFLTDPYNVTPQVAIYSLVNSLTELGTVRHVQITVDGRANARFMDNISLSSAFDRNDAIVYHPEGNENTSSGSDPEQQVNQ